MIICDSCKANNKVVQAIDNVQFATLFDMLNKSFTSDQFHLCNDCQKSLENITNTLAYVVQRRGIHVLAEAINRVHCGLD